MISGIILAAGESKRMGEQNKLMLPFRGKTMVENIVDVVLGSDVDEAIVVLGHEAERVKTVLSDRPLQFVTNHYYQQGMTSSIQCGVKVADSQSQGLMICLSDMPLIQVDDLNYLLEYFQQSVRLNPDAIVLPVFQGQRGHPVIFSSSYKPEILAHQAPNGCKRIIQQHSPQVLAVEMGADRLLKDIDTENDYQKLLSHRVN